MDEIKTLIFRTDRLGDFIISCPFIMSYKKKFPKTKITLVSSEYNANYIRNFHFINETVPLKTVIKFLPKLLTMIKMILYLRKTKFKDIIVLDGKKRSFFISLFLYGTKSILLQSRKLQLLSRIFNYKNVINYEIQNQLKNFSYLANLLNFNIIKKDIDIYQNYEFKKNFHFKKKYIIIHLDEKWYSDHYYTDFTDINPDSLQIDIFIKKIIEVVKEDFEIVITTGSKKIEKLDNFIFGFKTTDHTHFTKIINNTNITHIKKTSFNDLESLVRKSSLLVCCEGGISHVSYNCDVNTIAFYEKNRLEHTEFWTGHMKKISLYPRKNMRDLLADNDFFNLLKTKLRQV